MYKSLKETFRVAFEGNTQYQGLESKTALLSLRLDSARYRCRVTF